MLITKILGTITIGLIAVIVILMLTDDGQEYVAIVGGISIILAVVFLVLTVVAAIWGL